MPPTPPERWNQISNLLQQLMDIPPAEQLQQLDKLCDGDLQLKKELQSFLEAHQQAGGFLNGLDADRTLLLLQTEMPAAHDIGPYRTIKELGRGGMGIVYLAERSDGQFEQQVALKLIKRGMDSDAIERRFLHERQILARLHHPNIARLLDGNVTPQGQPYFAMEYIDGETLTTYCDRKNASIDERLRLFGEVAKAVQYAHANLVVHRDLKPSNMLVDKEGQLKLLDFGIARVLTGEGELEGSGLTDAGARVMTPEYAAPEQMAGEPVTTSADVYALGVVLYELLTGHRPFRFTARLPQMLGNEIYTIAPPPPSTAVGSSAAITLADGSTSTLTPEIISKHRGLSSDRLRRRLLGDLDTIVLKALNKEPQRRYASAEAFVEDINRHLKGLPVNAQRDTLGYRVNKFVSRHAVGVSLSVLIVLMIAGFGVAMGYQQQQTAAERDKAQLEAIKAERVTAFMMDLFDANYPDDAGGDTLNAFELMERGKEKAGALSQEPAVQAEMLEVMGRIYERMGKLEDAEPLVEQSLKIRQALFPNGHEDLASSLNRMGLLRWNQGAYAQAEPFLLEALEMKKAMLGEPHPEVASAMNDLAKLYRYMANYKASESLFRSALLMREALFGSEHEDVATTSNNLALLLLDMGKLAEAEQLFRKTLAIYRRIYGDEHSFVAIATGNLSLVLERKGAYSEAIALRKADIAMHRRLLGESHQNVAVGLRNLANLLMQAGGFEEARPIIEESYAKIQSIHPGNHPVKAHVLSTYADLSMHFEEFAKAESLYTASLAMRRLQLGASHPLTIYNLYAIANLNFTRGDHEAADDLITENNLLEGLKVAFGSAHFAYGRGLLLKGQIHLEAKDIGTAEDFLERALDVLQASLPANHVDVVNTKIELARCMIITNRQEDAEALLLSTLKVIEAQPLINQVLYDKTIHILGKRYATREASTPMPRP